MRSGRVGKCCSSDSSRPYAKDIYWSNVLTPIEAAWPRARTGFPSRDSHFLRHILMWIERVGKIGQLPPRPKSRAAYTLRLSASKFYRFNQPILPHAKFVESYESCATRRILQQERQKEKKSTRIISRREQNILLSILMRELIN